MRNVLCLRREPLLRQRVEEPRPAFLPLALFTPSSSARQDSSGGMSTLPSELRLLLEELSGDHTVAGFWATVSCAIPFQE